MITFDRYFKDNLYENCLKFKITSPTKPIFRVEYCPKNMDYLPTGTACIFPLSEFVTIAQAKVTVFFILIDNKNIVFDDSCISNYVLLPDYTDGEQLFMKSLAMLESSRLIDGAYTAITHELFNNASIKTLLKITADLIGNPIFLSDTSTKILDTSDENELAQVNDELIKCVLENGFVTSDLFEKYDYANLLKTIEQSKKAFLLESHISEKSNRIIASIMINNQYFGWLVAVISRNEFKPEHCEILDILANAISIELERNKTSLALNSTENLLLDLFTGQFASAEDFGRRARGFGWTLSESYNIIVICHQNPTNNTTQSGMRSMMAYKNHLSLVFPSIKSIYIKERLVLLLESRVNAQILNNLEIFLNNYNLIASVSNSFSNIVDFKEYYEQAADILNLGLRLNKESNIFYYNDLYLYHCIDTLKKTGHLEYYCLPELLQVVKYDRSYNTNFAETVHIYLNFRNIKDTADYLKIHRNTLIYRLEKFKELTNLNLSNGNDIYKLWLSFLILEVSPNIVS